MTEQKDYTVTLDVPEEVYNRWKKYLKDTYGISSWGRFSAIRNFNARMFIEKIEKEMEG